VGGKKARRGSDMNVRIIPPCRLSGTVFFGLGLLFLSFVLAFVFCFRKRLVSPLSRREGFPEEDEEWEVQSAHVSSAPNFVGGILYNDCNGERACNKAVLR
jgi:hypothetical protein